MSKYQLYILAFFEGVSVLIIELLGGKLLIPYFGNSLVIWTSTIGITMSSLMVGYFIGSNVSKKESPYTALFFIFAFVAAWISVMPIMAPNTISLFADSGLYFDSIISAILLLSTPLILLGITPPVIINLFKKESTGDGKISGRVFALSTVGSVFSTIVVGFFVIEQFGVSLPMLLYGGLLFLLSILLLQKMLPNKIFILLGGLPLVFSFMIFAEKSNNSTYDYKSESLQGQIKIQTEQDSPYNVVRRLYLNGIPQTSVKMFQDPLFNESLWHYVHMDGALSSSKPKGSEALLMGFGGGSIAQELIKMGFNLDVIEVDERLPQIAQDYFDFDTTKAKFHLNDARYFINNLSNKKTYDLAVLDLLHGEVQPNHVLTVEGMTQLKASLQKDALVIINYQSLGNEPKKPFLSILKTLNKSGYNAIVYNPQGIGLTDYIFIASPSALPKTLINKDNLNDCCYRSQSVKQFITKPRFLSLSHLSDSILNTVPLLLDDKPMLEILNKESIREWRKSYLVY